MISAPAKDPDVTLVLGVNEDTYDRDTHHLISMASCTTNCLAPVVRVLLDEFGVEQGFMTTTHAYTSDQRLHDIAALRSAARARGGALDHPDLDRRGTRDRARDPGAQGQARRHRRCASRCRTARSSTSSARSAARPSVEEINAAVKARADTGRMKGILAYTEDEIVSQDIVGNPYSSIFDAKLTMAHGRQAKVISWYDNEWGFSNRLVDLIDQGPVTRTLPRGLDALELVGRRVLCRVDFNVPLRGRRDHRRHAHPRGAADDRARCASAARA